MTQIPNNITLYSSQVGSSPKKTSEQVSVTNNQYGKDNLIGQYLDKLAQQNKPLDADSTLKPKFSPSGVDNYENMTVKDVNGNTVQEVKYSKEGSKIIENVKVNSYDGSALNKEMTKDGNKKTMTLDFKDKDGKILVQESRTYEKLDDDTAISTRNGEQYKISGLKGNLVTVEHNNEKKVIDFNKLVTSETENIDQSKTGKQITDEQKEFLISRFKDKSGDLLLTMGKEVDKLTFLDTDGYEAWYAGYPGHQERYVKTCRAAKALDNIHELGHGVNEFNDKSLGGARWTDKNEEYQNVRNAEINNLNSTTKSKDLKDLMQKFTNCEYFVKGGLMTPEIAKLEGADEEFAETFGFMNNIDVEDVKLRTTSLVQYMPKSVAIAYNASKNI